MFGVLRSAPTTIAQDEVKYSSSEEEIVRKILGCNLV